VTRIDKALGGLEMCHSTRGLKSEHRTSSSTGGGGLRLVDASRKEEANLTVKDATIAAMRFRNMRQWLRDLIRDLAYSLRRLRRTPGFALTVIAVLALGVGAATAIYAFVDATLVKPMPYREPTRLMALFEHNPVGDRFHLSDFDYRTWKERNDVFTSLDVYEPYRGTLDRPAGPEMVSTALVSDGFFRTLGVTPALGRDFLSGEDRPSAPQTTILSYATWKYRFAGDEKVLGRTVKLGGEWYTIVGVLPRGFHFAPGGPRRVLGDAARRLRRVPHLLPVLWRGEVARWSFRQRRPMKM
jgi:hypothetical protein